MCEGEMLMCVVPGKLYKEEKMSRALRMVGIGMLCLLVIGGLAISVVAASREKIVVNTYGGAYERMMVDVIGPAFEMRYPDIQLEWSTGIGSSWLADCRAAGPENAPYDALYINEFFADLLRRDDYYEPLTEGKVPFLKQVYDNVKNADGLGVIVWLQPIGIAYRTDLLADMGKEPPTSWRDLWDSDYDDLRGIFTITNTAGFEFLLTCATIFGESEYDYDAAMEAIKDLKPYKMADFSGSMELLLERGEIVVGILDRPAVTRLKKQGLPLGFVYPEEGVFMYEQVINVLKGSENKDAAFKYVNWLLSPEAQRILVETFYAVPTNFTTEIPEDLLGEILLRGEAMNDILQWDWSVHNEARDSIIEDWNKYVVGG